MFSYIIIICYEYETSCSEYENWISSLICRWKKEKRRKKESKKPCTWSFFNLQINCAWTITFSMLRSWSMINFSFTLLLWDIHIYCIHNHSSSYFYTCRKEYINVHIYYKHVTTIIVIEMVIIIYNAMR